jgi:hypothetical protein
MAVPVFGAEDAGIFISPKMSPSAMTNSNLVEIVNALDHEGSYKVVQLVIDEKPVIVLGDIGQLHSGLLESLLKERHLAYEMIQAPGMKGSVKVPALQGPRYRVVGAGEASLYPHSKLYTGMGGRSQTYNLEPDGFHAKMFAETLKAMGWKVM